MWTEVVVVFSRNYDGTRMERERKRTGCVLAEIRNTPLANRSHNTKGGLVSLWLYKENNKLRDLKMYLLYIFPPELHTLMASLF
jgi:hypothetical protein